MKRKGFNDVPWGILRLLSKMSLIHWFVILLILHAIGFFLGPKLSWMLISNSFFLSFCLLLIWGSSERLFRLKASFMSTQVTGRMKENPLNQMAIGDQIEKDMAIMVCRIRHQVSFMQRSSNLESIKRINAWLSKVKVIVEKHGGIISSFEGFKLVILFPDTPQSALDASKALYDDFKSDDDTSIQIGLDYNYALYGLVGDDDWLQSCVIGEGVSIAHFIESENGVFESDVTVSHSMVSQFPQSSQMFRFLDFIKIEGMQKKLEVYQFLVEPNLTKDVFQEAVSLFYLNQIKDALMLFKSILIENSEDKVVCVWIERCLKGVDEAHDLWSSTSLSSNDIDGLMIGIPEIDSLNEVLLKHNEQLNRAIQFGESKKVVGKILDDLMYYPLQIFTIEESIMDEYNYPYEIGHQLEHQEFLAKIALLHKEKMQASSITHHLVFQLQVLLCDWISEHIFKSDRRFGVFLNSQFEQHNRVLEQHVALRTKVLEEKEVELIEAKECAELANHAKTQFLSNMSHEIRTPMNAIMGFTGICLALELPQQQRGYLNKVSHAADQLMSLFSDILDFSQIESGSISLEMEHFDVSELLADLVDQFEALALQQGLSIDCSIDVGFVRHIIADKRRVTKVLQQLVKNSIEFSSQGKISLRVELSQDNAEMIDFMVSDQGDGIAPEIINEIFMPFMRGEMASTRQHSGTGLGLSICHRMAGLMQGELLVDSMLEQGSLFTLSIPYVASLDAQYQAENSELKQFNDPDKAECDVQLPHITGINVYDGWVRLGGNLEGFKKILVKFATSKQYAIKEIRSSFGEQDVNQARLLTHSLKGLAGNIAAESLYQLLIDLEHEIIDEQLNGDKAESLLQQMELELKRVIDSIKEELVSSENVTQVPLELLTAEQAQTQLSGLLRLLEKYDTDAHDYLDDILRQLPDGQLKKSLQTLILDIEGYQFELAAKKLMALLR